MAPVGKAKETAATPWFEERVAPDTKTRQLVVRFRHRSLYPLPQVAAATALLLFLWWANVPVAQVVCSSPPYSKFKAPETGDQPSPSAAISSLIEGKCVVEWPSVTGKAFRWITASGRRTFSLLNWKDATVEKAVVLQPATLLQWLRRTRSNETRVQVWLSYTETQADTTAKRFMFHDYGVGAAAEKRAQAAVDQMKAFLFHVETRMNSAEWQEWREIMLERIKARERLEARAAMFGIFGDIFNWLLSLLSRPDAQAAKYVRRHAPPAKYAQEPPLALTYGEDVSWIEEGWMALTAAFIAGWLLLAPHREELVLDADDKDLTLTQYSLLGRVVRKLEFELDELRLVREVRRERFGLDRAWRRTQWTEFGLELVAEVAVAGNAAPGVAQGAGGGGGGGGGDGGGGGAVSTQSSVVLTPLLCGLLVREAERPQLRGAVTAIDEFLRSVEQSEERSRVAKLEDFKLALEGAKPLAAAAVEDEDAGRIVAFSVEQHVADIESEVALRLMAPAMAARVPEGVRHDLDLHRRRASLIALQHWGKIRANLRALRESMKLDRELAAL